MTLLRWLMRHWLWVGLAVLPMLVVGVYIDEYGRNVPVNDQWLDPLDIAFHAQNGTLELDHITGVYYGHRAVFTNAMTALLSLIGNWQPKTELYIIWGLAVLRFILLAGIFHALCPDKTPFALLPFSLLIFSAYGYLLWLSGIYAVWGFVTLFGMAAIWVLVRFPVGWRPLTGAAALAACASFSQGSGIVTFPVFAITLWMFGYRRPAYYLFWVGVMLLTLGAYFSGGALSSGEAGEGGLTGADHLTVLPRFFFAFLGNPFSVNLQTDTAQRMGVIGVVVFICNGLYLRWQDGHWRRVAPWLTLVGFATSVAIIIFLTRYREERFIYAVEQRYSIIASQLWIALLATGILIFGLPPRPNRNLSEKALLVANGGLLLAGGLFYLQANLWNWQATANRYTHLIGETYLVAEGAESNLEDQCILNFPLRRDFTCLSASVALGGGSDEDIYRMAYYEMGIFAGQQEEIRVLPSEYRPGSPLILDTPSIWMNAYLRRWYLPGVAEADMYHIAPPALEMPITTLRDPLMQVTSRYDAESIAAFVEDAPTVWYLRTREQQPNEVTAYAVLSELGYLPTVILSSDPRYNSELTLVRYERAPDETEERARFGEFITLQAVDILGDPRACETITALTWWQTDAALPTNYGLALRLVDASGVVVAEVSSGLSTVPTALWGADQPFLDERALSLPCDLPPGDYTLTLNVVNPENGENLRQADYDLLMFKIT